MANRGINYEKSHGNQAIIPSQSLLSMSGSRRRDTSSWRIPVVLRRDATSQGKYRCQDRWNSENTTQHHEYPGSRHRSTGRGLTIYYLSRRHRSKHWSSNPIRQEGSKSSRDPNDLFTEATNPTQRSNVYWTHDHHETARTSGIHQSHRKGARKTHR